METINSTSPLCACGCGQRVTWHRKRRRWNTFRQGHWAKAHAYRGAECYNWKGGIKRDPHGYVFVLLRSDHPRASKGYVRRATLVVEQKIGRLLVPGEQVHHLNAVKDDDRPENLEVVTPSQHWQYHGPEMIRRSNANQKRGSQLGQSKLTEDKVREIKALLGTMSQRQIAFRFGVTPPQITRIKQGHIWRHVS